MKTIALQEKGKKRLGDKVECIYSLEQTESSVQHLIDSVREFLSKEGKNIQELLYPENENHVIKEYEAIRKHLDICAGIRQQDVWGFIRVILHLVKD